MSKSFLVRTAAVLAVAAGVASANTVSAAPPFGGPEDTAFAAKLWHSLLDAKFVGPNTIVTYPYDGTPPHGDVLSFIRGKVKVAGRNATVLVKKNYRGKGIDDDDVLKNPGKYLKSITVMFKREAGYDPGDQNWFWVKYSPNGNPLKNPKGMKLAGRVAKGMTKGCIACHSKAGDDFVYTPTPIAN